MTIVLERGCRYLVLFKMSLYTIGSRRVVEGMSWMMSMRQWVVIWCVGVWAETVDLGWHSAWSRLIVCEGGSRGDLVLVVPCDGYIVCCNRCIRRKRKAASKASYMLLADYVA